MMKMKAKKIATFENLVFQGGSVKGVAYIGALQVLIAAGITLDDIRRVAGTSAGAITALLLSIGCTIEQAEEIVKNTDFKAFLDETSGNTRDPLLTKAGKRAGKLKKVKALPKTVKALPTVTSRLYNEYGLYDGKYFLDFAENLITSQLKRHKIITEKVEKSHLTFQELHNLATKEVYRKLRFKDLYVVGVNLNTGLHEIFSWETTPNLIISDAVRISMSIPFIFKPHCMWGKNANGERVKHSLEHLYADGGITFNFPLSIFDKDKYINPKRTTQDKTVVNPRTLGFKLVSTDVKKFLEGKAKAPASKIDGFFQYAKAVLFSIYAQQESYHANNKSHKERTVNIDTLDVEMLDFDITNDRKNDLIEQGRNAAIEYFQKRFGIVVKKSDLPKLASASTSQPLGSQSKKSRKLKGKLKKIPGKGKTPKTKKKATKPIKKGAAKKTASAQASVPVAIFTDTGKHRLDRFVVVHCWLPKQGDKFVTSLRAAREAHKPTSPNPVNIGHVTISIHDGDSCEYISFWPTEGGKKVKVESVFSSYCEDITVGEDRVPDVQIVLYSLNVKNIKNRFNYYVKLLKEKRLFWTLETQLPVNASVGNTHSCASFAWNLLLTGGIKQICNTATNRGGPKNRALRKQYSCDKSGWFWSLFKKMFWRDWIVSPTHILHLAAAAKENELKSMPHTKKWDKDKNLKHMVLGIANRDLHLLEDDSNFPNAWYIRTMFGDENFSVCNSSIRSGRFRDNLGTEFTQHYHSLILRESGAELMLHDIGTYLTGHQNHHTMFCREVFMHNNTLLAYCSIFSRVIEIEYYFFVVDMPRGIQNARLVYRHMLKDHSEVPLSFTVKNTNEIIVEFKSGTIKKPIARIYKCKTSTFVGKSVHKSPVVTSTKTVFADDYKYDYNDDEETLGNSETDPEYMYYIQDGHVLAMDIRRRRFTYQNSHGHVFRCPGGEEYSATRQAAQRTFLSDPYDITQFNDRFLGDIDIITGRRTGQYIKENNRWTRMPRRLVISFLSGGHWLGVRAQINYIAGTVDFLWDDSFGGQHPSFNTVSNALINGIQILIRTQRSNDRFVLGINQIVHRFKTFDQQGIGINGVDCGPIRFQNANDHVNSNVSNANFASSDRHYRVKQAQTENHDMVIRNIRIRDRNAYRRITEDNTNISPAHRNSIASAKKSINKDRQEKFKSLQTNEEVAFIIKQLNGFKGKCIRLFHKSIEKTRILTGKNLGKPYNCLEISSAFQYVLSKKSNTSNIKTIYAMWKNYKPNICEPLKKNKQVTHLINPVKYSHLRTINCDFLVGDITNIAVIKNDIIVANDAHEIILWNMDGERFQTIDKRGIRRITVVADDTIITWGVTVEVWQYRDGNLRLIRTIANRGICNSIVTLNNGLTITGDGSGRIKIWRFTPDNYQHIRTIEGDDRCIHAMAAFSDNSIIVGNVRGIIKHWQFVSNEWKCNIISSERDSAIFAITTLKNGIIVTGHMNGNIKIRNINGKNLATLNANEHVRNSCVRCLVPFDNNTFISSTDENIIKFWRLKDNNWQCIDSIKNAVAPFGYSSIIKILLLSNGIMISGGHKRINIWKPISGRP